MFSAEELENVPSQPKVVTLQSAVTSSSSHKTGAVVASAPPVLYNVGTRTFVNIPLVDDASAKGAVLPPPLASSTPSRQSSAASVPAGVVRTPEEEKAIQMMKEKASLKVALIKSMEKLNIRFHEEYHDISLAKELKLPIVAGESVITVKLPELEPLATELADRRVYVCFRSLAENSVVIKFQIAKVVVDGRVPTIEILLRSKIPTIKPLVDEHFLRLRIERAELDAHNQFFLPVGDTFHSVATEQLFDPKAVTVASTLNDEVLLPKSYHSVRCSVPLKPEEAAGVNDTLVILERTADHGMYLYIRPAPQK
jgi:hypothetical protein